MKAMASLPPFSVDYLFVVKCVILFLLFSSLSGEIWVRGAVVKVGKGSVNGTTMAAADGKIFNAFLGIPYAIPPVGRLRFKAPIQAPSWSGILDTTKEPNICVQIPDKKTYVSGNEDCLTLNIYAPRNAKIGDKIPVLFYIFGGVFKFGSSVVNGPQNFMTRDIIVVMPNFRLEILGYLSTGDDVISGNMGLKDQSMALKWVKHNIHFFGGDPNRITMHGHSAGSICAHLHTLSPMSKGLFNRVILQSGTGRGLNSFFNKDVSRCIAKEVAELVGCKSSTSQEMFDCFINLQPEIFPIVAKNMSMWKSFPSGLLRPTIENINSKNPFLITPPIETNYESTDQEWMIGMTTGEGVGDAAQFLSHNGSMAKEINEQYSILMPIILQYLWHSKRKHLDYISDSLWRYYFGNQEMGANTSSSTIRLYSDGTFGYETIDALRRYAGTKYVYLFDYISGFTIYENSKYDTFYGIKHSDELPLLFQIAGKSDYLNATDRIFGDEMVKRWTNFAYSGNPNKPFPIDTSLFGPWKPSISSDVDFLRLKLNGTMESDYYSKNYHLWKHLPIFSKDTMESDDYSKDYHLWKNLSIFSKEISKNETSQSAKIALRGMSHYCIYVTPLVLILATI